MGHDMSDQAMAQAMEADMRNRFFVSLILTIPVILYSPLGTSLFKVHTPYPLWHQPKLGVVRPCNASRLVGRLDLSLCVWRALRNRTLDMNVLVSLGVLVAYFFSVFATFFCPASRDEL